LRSGGTVHLSSLSGQKLAGLTTIVLRNDGITGFSLGDFPKMSAQLNLSFLAKLI
jgi:hypothetical protein